MLTAHSDWSHVWLAIKRIWPRFISKGCTSVVFSSSALTPPPWYRGTNRSQILILSNANDCSHVDRRLGKDFNSIGKKITFAGNKISCSRIFPFTGVNIKQINTKVPFKYILHHFFFNVTKLCPFKILIFYISVKNVLCLINLLQKLKKGIVVIRFSLFNIYI